MLWCQFVTDQKKRERKVVEKKEKKGNSPKRKRGRQIIDLMLKDRREKEINRSLRRSMEILNRAADLSPDQGSKTRIEVAQAYVDLLSVQDCFPTDAQIAKATKKSINTIRIHKKELMQDLNTGDMQDMISTYRQPLLANIFRRSLDGNPMAMKLSAQIIGALQEDTQQVSFNQSSTIYEIVTESKNEKIDRPAPP